METFFLTFGPYIFPMMIVLLAIVLQLNDYQDAKFVKWIKTNSDEILQTGKYFRGRLINRNTKFVRYRVIISAIFFSFDLKTRIRVSGDILSILDRVFAISITAVLGWWSVAGFIMSFSAIYSNIFDSKVGIFNLDEMDPKREKNKEHTVVF